MRQALLARLAPVLMLISMLSNAHAQALNGYWEDAPNGLILEIHADSPNTHRVTRVFDINHNQEACVVDVYNQRIWEHFTQDVESLSIHHNTLTIRNFADENVRTFSKLRRLPKACVAAKATHDPLANFDFVTGYFKEYYPDLALRLRENKELHANSRFDELIKQHRAQLSSRSSDTQLFHAISAVLRALEDAHINLQREQQHPGVWDWGVYPHSRADLNCFHHALAREYGAAYGSEPFAYQQSKSLARWSQLVDTHYLKQAKHDLFYAQNGTAPILTYGVLKGNRRIGYFRIRAELLNDGEFSDKVEMRKMTHGINTAMHYLATQRCQALVIDLRDNEGGNDYYSFYLARFFIDRPHLAYQYTKRYQHQWSSSTRVMIKPINTRHWQSSLRQLPLSVLISPMTYSAGENLAAILKSLPQATLYGYPTVGIFAEQATRQMPNGWLFTIPMGHYRFAHNTSYLSTGVTPTVSTPCGENFLAREYLQQGRDIILDRVLRETKTGPKSRF